MKELVKLSGVAKSFGAVRAVDALDLALGQGEILGFLGTNANGSSKGDVKAAFAELSLPVLDRLQVQLAALGNEMASDEIAFGGFA